MNQSVEYIKWIDAVASTGWAPKSTGFPIQICHSVGVVIEDTKEHIALAGSWGETQHGEPDVNCVISIPKAWIKQRKKLKV